MSRTLSGPSLAALLAQETGEAFLVLLTLDHADLADPIRVSSDSVDTTSRGELYVHYPFDLKLPGEADRGKPIAGRLGIDNVHRDLVVALDAIKSPANVTIEIVRGSDPDTVEASWTGFKLRVARHNALRIEGDLSRRDLATQRVPAHRYTPGNTPGLF